MLQNTGDRDQSDLAKDRPGEDGEGFRCFDGPEPSEYNCNGQQAADALTQESGPGNACYAHTKALDEPDIHQDIGSRREGQEYEGSFGIAHSGEYTCGNIVKEKEGKSLDIDIQIQG